MKTRLWPPHSVSLTGSRREDSLESSDRALPTIILSFLCFVCKPLLVRTLFERIFIRGRVVDEPLAGVQLSGRLSKRLCVSHTYASKVMHFLSDPGIPGVRSMGPSLSNSCLVDLTDVTLVDEDTNLILADDTN